MKIVYPLRNPFGSVQVLKVYRAEICALQGTEEQQIKVLEFLRKEENRKHQMDQEIFLALIDKFGEKE